MTGPARENLDDLIGAVALDPAAKQHALELLGGADRFYHGLDHVALLWRRHRAHALDAGFDDAHDYRLIASAILFHDCVYAADRPDNEERSAEAWLDACAGSAIDARDRAWVADTIRATRDHLGYATGVREAGSLDRPEALRLWMLDLDLSPLGEAPEVFDRNSLLLRAEASHLDDAAFEAVRLAGLQHFAEVDILYTTPSLAARFDAPARRNFARHLAVPNTVHGA